RALHRSRRGRSGNGTRPRHARLREDVSGRRIPAGSRGRRRHAGRRLTELVLRNGLVDVGAGEFARADVAVSNGRIVARAPDGAEVVDCSRFLVVPGMVNAHNHSNENWFRGMWDNLPLEPWMLFSYPA